MSKILSPKEWIKKVYGKSTFQYYEEERLSIESVLQLMFDYSMYVEKRVRRNSIG